MTTILKIALKQGAVVGESNTLGFRENLWLDIKYQHDYRKPLEFD